MADPTLKDVLNAIAKLDAKVDAHRTEAKGDLAELRTEMSRRFDGLDEELTTHAKVHRKSKTTSRP